MSLLGNERNFQPVIKVNRAAQMICDSSLLMTDAGKALMDNLLSLYNHSGLCIWFYYKAVYLIFSNGMVSRKSPAGTL